tara:strand:- start:2193 stop:2708 length:516 start_codon:yes stop_codon:yes gene_type:complete
MNCLTQSEIEHWLLEHSVTPAPYGKTESPTHYIQFAVPSRPLANAAFIRQFLKLTNGDVLVHVTDWPTYEPSEMAVVDALRHNWEESRNLIDAAGHLIPSNEHELAIALFGHTGNFEWNSYLYLPHDLATLYNWEGSRYDFWSNDKNTYEQLSKLVVEFELDVDVIWLEHL